MLSKRALFASPVSSGSSMLGRGGGVNGDLLQEGLCHTQVCCTQSPCLCGRPLLTSTGDAQTQFCLSLCGVPGSWCTQGMCEPSEHLWWEWGLILNMMSPLLPSCWGFSFALGRGVSSFGGLQHSSVDGCLAVSCSFGVLTGDVDCMSFYAAILRQTQAKSLRAEPPERQHGALWPPGPPPPPLSAERCIPTRLPN